jgi:hypothetical protein
MRDTLTRFLIAKVAVFAAMGTAVSLAAAIMIARQGPDVVIIAGMDPDTNGDPRAIAIIDPDRPELLLQPELPDGLLAEDAYPVSSRYIIFFTRHFPRSTNVEVIFDLHTGRTMNLPPIGLSQPYIQPERALYAIFMEPQEEPEDDSQFVFGGLVIADLDAWELSPTLIEGPISDVSLWSSDARLAFVHAGSIYITARYGIDPQPIAPAEQPGATQLLFSPDAAALAVVTGNAESERMAISVIDLASGDMRPLYETETDTGVWAGTVAWTPDSRSLVAYSGHGERVDAAIIDVASGDTAPCRPACRTEHPSESIPSAWDDPTTRCGTRSGHRTGRAW